MDVDMETSPSYFDPQDHSAREKFRRYGKRYSNSSISPRQESGISKFNEAKLLYEGQIIHSPTNAALLLENIKQEAESFDTDYFEETPAREWSASKRRPSSDGHRTAEIDNGVDSIRRLGSHALKACKIEDDLLADNGDATFASFASLLDSAFHGVMPIPDLILQFERICRNVSESIRRLNFCLMRLLHGLSCVTDEPPEELILSPSTSHIEACQFVANDHTAQLCLRIVQWLEELASKALDLENKVRGSHVGTYLPNSGIWYHTQRFLKKGASAANTIHHLDFDAPTREHAHQLPDDKKQDESLLEDVWTLLRAGRLEEACELCRSAGQPWRSATICPFGGLDLFPSIEALMKNGKNRSLQAIELESGIGHQWRLWKWASYCASERIFEQNGGKYEIAVYAAQCSNLKRMLPICTDWETACWAMAKSWLEIQVDLELARSQPGRMEQLKSYGDGIDGSPGGIDGTSQPSPGPESWPLQVLNQQPRDLSALLQKLHSGEMVHEAVTRGCKEQQRQIEMNLMLGNIPLLLELIWSWIAPSEDDQNISRPHDPQMIRFGAHVVLVLRYLLAEEIKDTFREKLMTVGDRILHMYSLFLFSKHHEELVGIYASQLASHRCIDLFVHMMELRLNSSVHVKYKIFLSAMEYLPFSQGDDSKGSFEEIIERLLSRSRETKAGKFDETSDVVEQHRLQSLQKALVVQWLCFTPPSTITDVKDISAKLLMRALIHREFALISMWRVPAMPIGAHELLSFLAEPLKQLSETPDTFEDYVSENLKEFQDWLIPVVILNRVNTTPVMQRERNPWLISRVEHISESMEPLFLELHSTAMLRLPSGESMCPDATVCAALMSALYSSATEEVVSERQLTVNVAISSKDSYSIEVILRCLAVEGDGIGPHILNDGGLLSAVMAAGFKGELARFQAGVTLEISRLDAWFSSKDGFLEGPATYIVQGLCRRCCIPEVILRCMQVSVSLMESGNPFESHDQLIELVSSSETGFINLFSQQQLQW
ncbi:nuclear pore complex protein NUP107 [Gossypium australe]|uniref:Nuclear pore complex protein n=2 Tax=Gossypium TaxID=3633 RepID=A0A5B6UE48_9ROSI|nr:nuclear pore complex protein NUP107 [Gossypium australe]